MSVLIDYSQFMIASVFVAQKTKTKYDTLDGLTRHVFFGQLLNYTKKFRREYGSLVMVCDGKSWRKDYFPHYKIMRAQTRDDSELDWKLVFEIMDSVKKDLIELGFPVVNAPGAEADDIVAAVAGAGGKHIIVSGDKDFAQLHRQDIAQYSPYTKNFIVIDDPKRELKKLVVSGDASDSIPNILTDDEFYLRKSQGKKERQKQIRGLEQLVDGDITGLPHYERNATLIDFAYIPADVRDGCLAAFEAQRGNRFNKNALMHYFAKNKMRVLLESVTDF